MTDILMPQMGLSVTEGTIIKWLVGVGDRVVADEVVCEITTDKTDAEVVASSDGVVSEILSFEGDVVAIGAVIGRMTDGPSSEGMAEETSKEPAPAASPERQEPNERRVPTSEPVVSRSRVEAQNSIVAPSPASSDKRTVSDWRSFRPVSQMLAGAVVDAEGAANALLAHLPTRSQPAASPLARRRAKALGLDLSSVRGSGRHGRVCIHDVITAANSGVALGANTAPVTSSPSSSALPIGYEDVDHEIVMTSPHRRAISEHMIRSRMTAAHMTTEVDVDMTKVTRVRSLVNLDRESRSQGRISFLPFIAKVTATTLATYPDLNATFQHDRSIRWSQVNLGVAVDTNSGLVVPVIRSVDRLNVVQLSDSIALIAERARARKLIPDDLRAGTFTISNPGSVGAVSAPAIINQPQVAILGIPTIQKRPWVVTSDEGVDAISIRSILRLALTFDHRAVDGAEATRFLVEVKDQLESWEISAYY